MKRKIIDPHYHASSRSSNDYESLALSGVCAIIEPCHRTRQKFDSLQNFIDVILQRINDEKKRANAFGLDIYFGLGAMPCDFTSNELFFESIEYLISINDEKEYVCHGEIELVTDLDGSKDLFIQQLELFSKEQLPYIINIPHRNRQPVFDSTIQILREVKQNKKFNFSNTILDGLFIWELNDLQVLNMGAYGVPVSPILDAPFVVFKKSHPHHLIEALNKNELDVNKIILNSSMGFGYGDAWGLAKVADYLSLMRISEGIIEDIFYNNAQQFYNLPNQQ